MYGRPMCMYVLMNYVYVDARVWHRTDAYVYVDVYWSVYVYVDVCVYWLYIYVDESIFCFLVRVCACRCVYVCLYVSTCMYACNSELITYHFTTHYRNEEEYIK
jgi:hypothetical protein